MALVTLKNILDTANTQGHAVAAFDTIDHLSAEAVIQAAEQLQRPVILMIAEMMFKWMDNADTFIPFLIDLAHRAKVPVAVILDHGESYESCVKAIHQGFTGVMIDGSSLPLKENIALTKKVVEVAHAAGISVEAEIGHVSGGEGNFGGSLVDESMYTDPAEAKLFVEETGVDALAVAVGSVHGVYKGTPKLDIPRLEEIKRLTKVPIVLHGGSGISDEEFVKGIKGGINKINIFTHISMSATKRSVDFALEKDMKLHFPIMLLEAKKAIVEVSSHYLDLFALKG